MSSLPASAELSLEDRMQIMELYHRYALAYDEADTALLETCFISQANFTCGVPDHPLLRSFDEIAARMHARHKERDFQERHVTTNIVVREVTGNEARVSAVAAIFVSPRGEPSQLEMTGRYDDQLVKEEGRWLFKFRSFHPDGEPLVIE